MEKKKPYSDYMLGELTVHADKKVSAAAINLLKELSEYDRESKRRYPNCGSCIALGPDYKTVVASGSDDDEAILRAHANGCPTPIIVHNC